MIARRGEDLAIAALALRRWRLAVAALLVTAGKLVAERVVWAFVQRSRPPHRRLRYTTRSG